jgi:hypothetical protein
MYVNEFGTVYVVAHAGSESCKSRAYLAIAARNV